LAIALPTSGGRLVGIVRSRTQTMEFSLVLTHNSIWSFVLLISGYEQVLEDQPLNTGIILEESDQFCVRDEQHLSFIVYTLYQVHHKILLQGKSFMVWPISRKQV
jgi:hypothetical protein